MIKQANKPGDQPERFRPELHRALGKLGWRMPQTEREVLAAEEWITKSPVRLPDRLSKLPDMNRSQESGRMLDRYLRDEEGRHSVEDSKSKDEDRSSRDLDR